MASADNQAYVKRTTADLLALLMAPSAALAESKFLSLYSSGKVFDYLAARRPILAIPSDGGVIDHILGETGAGVGCTTVDEIAAQLLKWYEEWRATGTIACGSDRQAVLRYSRKEQTGQLAKVLDRVVAESKKEKA